MLTALSNKCLDGAVKHFLSFIDLFPKIVNPLNDNSTKWLQTHSNNSSATGTETLEDSLIEILSM